MREAKAVVVLWSKKSVDPRWVRAEATLADRNKTLAPCMIEPCERPIMFELTQTAELSHWQGDATDKAWLGFLAGVKRFVAKETAPTVEAPTTPIEAPTLEETLKPGQSGSAPSLAVLPFTNRSSLPEDEVFAEGIVEDLISALTQGVNVRVLGSTSTAHLRKSATTDLSAVGRQLGVRYLLEGNVRRVGANLRITTQLLEAETGTAMWTGKFDRPLAELSELQEELVTDIAGALDTQVYGLEMERALRKPGDITAREAVARSTSVYRKYDDAALQSGIEEARRAIAIAPDYAPGHAMLAAALANAYTAASPDDPAEVQRIRAIAERAIALAPDDASVLSYVGYALSYVGDLEDGARHTLRAVRKAPGSGLVRLFHGVTCGMLNRPEASLSHLKVAERLMPGSHMMCGVKGWQSNASRELGRFAEAESAIDECNNLNQTDPFTIVCKALLCVRLGRDDEARRHIETARKAGWDAARAERYWRRLFPNSPRLEGDIATVRALYAATEPGA